MLLFSTILKINDTMTKEAFMNLVIEWNHNNPHEVNRISGIAWNGDPRYTIALAKTPSDNRSGDNIIGTISRKVF